MIVAATSAKFVRPGGEIALADFTWQCDDGEAWAIVGSTGSGKTTLLDALLGRLRLEEGTLQWPLGDPRLVAQLVSFREDSRQFRSRDFYYQQRYEFADSDSPLTLKDYLGDAEPIFGLDLLLAQPFITLSNGQMRKARIAKALAKKPGLLILDDPFLGLDFESRRDLGLMLGDLLNRGQRILITCRPDDIPHCMTHVLHMENQRIIWSGPRQAFTFKPSISTSHSTETNTNIKLQSIIELRDVTVRHGGAIILDNVSWTVHAGERWALLGPNGAGKTTLLSLIVGDHPQAFSNDVRLFGSRRGSGETVWDIRRRVGFVSPEFHLYFAEDLTAAEAAETGFHDTLLHRKVTENQAAAVRELFAELGVAELADRRMRQLSTGQQRLALLVRALIKKPPLLVLDEPYQGLDPVHVQRLNAWLERHLNPDQTLIVTTHRMDELPGMVSRQLRLLNGRVA